MNELKLNVVEFTPTPIKWNQEEVSQVVNEIVAKYEGLEFTEEDVAAAKKDRAALNKVAKNLSSKRIAVKKEYSKELVEFENGVKELENKIKDTSSNIDAQIKAFEQKEKDQKREAIEELEEYKLVSDYVVFDEKWLNKSVKFDDIIEELNAAHDQINKDINVIKMACTDKGFESDKYIERLKQMELTDVLTRINEDYALVNQKEVEEVEEVIEESNEQVLDVVRHIKGTKTQLKKLKEFADKIGVEIYA